jgi:hypothetical protein
MRKEIRRIDFDEFAAQLPALLETLAREHEQVLVEKEGKIYRVGATDESASAKPHDAEAVRRALARSTGALGNVDRRTLMRDIHAGRQQASRGRPA